jgi:hypothetical protein
LLHSLLPLGALRRSESLPKVGRRHDHISSASLSDEQKLLEALGEEALTLAATKGERPSRSGRPTVAVVVVLVRVRSGENVHIISDVHINSR